jgi:hypothetical protein
MRRCSSWIAVLLGLASVTLRVHGQSEAVSFTRQGDTIQVAIGGKPFTTYNFDPKTAKAYLQPLRNASGVIVTRDFPIGDTIPAGHEHDRNLEPHQRAMYFAHGDINGFNFWSEEVFSKYYGDGYHSAFGRMVLRKIEAVRGGRLFGTIRATFDRLPRKFNSSRSAATVTHARSTVSLSFVPVKGQSSLAIRKRAFSPCVSLPNWMRPTEPWSVRMAAKVKLGYGVSAPTGWTSTASSMGRRSASLSSTARKAFVIPPIGTLAAMACSLRIPSALETSYTILTRMAVIRFPRGSRFSFAIVYSFMAATTSRRRWQTDTVNTLRTSNVQVDWAARLRKKSGWGMK